jgi:enoyl-CoA hydratase
MTASVPEVAVELRGPALWICINRPDALNALNAAVVDGIDLALDRALRADARCVVLTGRGRAFCTGVDLKVAGSLSEDPAPLMAFVKRVCSLVERIERHPQPVIAAINGLTLAGGLELALACDVILASEDAKIADGHANYGLFPGAGGTVRLPRRVGINRALELLFTGDFATAVDLQRDGLINRTVAPGRLDDSVAELAATIARRSPEALARMKRTVRETIDMPLADALAREFAEFAEHMRGAAAAEGIAAFNQKRQPKFDR